MYTSSDVANRIKELAKQQKISLKDLLSNAGLGFNAMSHMKTSMPRADSLAKIADQLSCSVDYLLGRTEIKEAPAEAEAKIKAIVDIYYKLSPKNKALLDSLLQSMLEQQGENM